jgi:Cys-tRNA(Pro)/Cys-tRNA(Cys) deacylase
MTNPADLAPAHLRQFLERHAVEAEFVAPGVPMPTVARAAAAINVPEAFILKTLLFAGEDGKFVVAIANGTLRVSKQLLAAASGIPRPRAAHPDEVVRITGYEAGGVSPLALPTGLTVIIDEQTAALPYAFGGGGVEELLLRVRPSDIILLQGASVANIVDRN